MKDHHVTISHFLNHGNWDFSELSYLLPSEFEEPIRDTIIPTTPNTNQNDDTIFWAISSTGTFSTASCYNDLTKTGLDSKINLNWLWKINVPEKIIMFLWLCWHERIKCNNLLNHRGMQISESCYKCPNISETPNHILRKCSSAQTI